MANRANMPITLPWRRPEKGVSAAELGASFRVEQREDGWHCTVKVGRRTEVLSTGLRRLRDAQCRAEAHAATMPEVAAALKKLSDTPSKGATKGASPTRTAARTPTPASGTPKPAPSDTASLPFERVSDGCICGKIEGGTWTASPKGTVSVPPGTDEATAQEICRIATNHYAAQDTATRPMPAKPGKRGAKRAAAAAAKKADVAAEHATGRDGADKRRASRVTKAAAKRLARKTASAVRKGDDASAGKVAAGAPAKAAAKGATRKADAPAKPAAKGAIRKGDAPATAAAKGATRKADAPARAAAKGATRKADTPAATRAKSATRKADTPAATRAKSATRKGGVAAVETATRATRKPAANSPAKEATVSKKSGKAAVKGETCGCVTWSETEAGGARGEAKHGTFTIETEGKKHALYFYDADGQSRHLQSGDASKLRKVAEEMAARGQPVPRPVSGVDDAALMRAFMGGALEDDR